MQKYKFLQNIYVWPTLKLDWVENLKFWWPTFFCRFIIHIFPIFDDDRMKNLGQICKSAKFFNSVPLKFEWVKTSKFWSPTFHQWVMGNICEKFCESRLKNKKIVKNFQSPKFWKGAIFLFFIRPPPKTNQFWRCPRSIWILNLESIGATVLELSHHNE